MFYRTSSLTGGSRVDIPQVRSTRCGDAVSLRVQVAADLHRVTRLTLVVVVVGGRLDEERVLALTHARYSLVVGRHECRRPRGRHERPHALIHGYRRLLHTSYVHLCCLRTGLLCVSWHLCAQLWKLQKLV